ncbi:MAG: SIS domain-containing protein [Bacteroides sp.]|nr:D-sedoheptulose 7-phosphate isomerase [Clostridia bacterium]
MTNINILKDEIEKSIAVKQSLLSDEKMLELVEKVSDVCVESYKNGGKVLACGNGGSASDAQHMTGELVGRYLMERQGIPAIALDANTTILTALGNDYSYEEAYMKEVVALGKKGDVLFAISTSGNSKNCCLAAKKAKELGIVTVALTGKNGGELKNICDYTFNVDSVETPRIQETHILIIHMICGMIERKFFN